MKDPSVRGGGAGSGTGRSSCRASVAALILAAALAAVSTPAHAAQPKPDDGTAGPTLDLGEPNAEASVEVSVSAQVHGGLTSNLALSGASSGVLSPARCTGYTDYPHKSGKDASVHGRMNCQYRVDYVGTTTTLARDRWYGLQSLQTQSSYRYNSYRSYDATPHWRCYGAGTYSYRGYSSHLAIENGVRYTASTSNWQIPGVSRFNC